MGPDGRAVPTKDPGARLGKRTVTQRQPRPYYVGYEEHLATLCRRVNWRGRPEQLGIGPAVVNFIVGVRVAPALENRGGYGAELIAAVKAHHPELSVGLADRGYTPLAQATFHDRVRALGVHLVQDYVRWQLEGSPKPIEVATDAGGTVKLLPMAGGFFHEFTPIEFFRNPVLPPNGTQERAEVEAYYNERASYLWRVHSYGPGGSVRLQCPVCAGRLRPLDLTVAANTGKVEMPALEVPEGTTECCAQTVVTVPAIKLGREFQTIPYGTGAWRKSFGRRALVENSNSVLQTGLARQSKGFIRVFGLAKFRFMLAMAAAAINLLLYEKEWLKTRVEVVRHDATDPSEVDKVFLDHFAESTEPPMDVFNEPRPHSPP